jgi:hypothetical protein
MPPTKASTDPAIDFMEPIDEDIPKGKLELANCTKLI